MVDDPLARPKYYEILRNTTANQNSRNNTRKRKPVLRQKRCVDFRVNGLSLIRFQTELVNELNIIRIFWFLLFVE